MTFRKAVMTEDVAEAKKDHRQKLHTLTEKYMEDVQSGKAEGIRNAKDLVEIMKMDLLLMGEANERTEQTTNIDEIRLNKMAQYISEDDPDVQKIMEQMMMGLNNANDDEDVASSKKQQEFAQAELDKFDKEEDSTQ